MAHREQPNTQDQSNGSGGLYLRKSTSRLERLEVRGFKSLRAIDLTFGPVNVLIGANGAGKSNLLSFFKMLNQMTLSPGELQFFVGRVGGANALLFDGAATTQEISASLVFTTDVTRQEYQFRLAHAAPDTLIFAEERYRSTPHNDKQEAWNSLGSGHREALISERVGWAPFRILRSIHRLSAYQFHNTSDTARVRQRWDVMDNHSLHDDAANLAPVLLRIQEDAPLAYRRIVETVRLILPFFSDFVLVPSSSTLFLQWRERGSDAIFGAHQASDGMLRLLALVTLLLQPTDALPGVLILDEPELGLHPYAIAIVAGLLQSVALHRQVILATQSTTLLDYFKPEQIIVVERVGRESVFRRLDHEPLAEWLQEYSISELWEKNVLGGQPGR